MRPHYFVGLIILVVTPGSASGEDEGLKEELAKDSWDKIGEIQVQLGSLWISEKFQTEEVARNLAALEKALPRIVPSLRKDTKAWTWEATDREGQVPAEGSLSSFQAWASPPWAASPWTAAEEASWTLQVSLGKERVVRRQQKEATTVKTASTTTRRTPPTTTTRKPTTTTPPKKAQSCCCEEQQ